MRWCSRRAPTNTYTGEAAQGLRHGKGTLKLLSGATYSGQWVFGEIDGQGEWRWPDGRCYVGQWSKGKMHGRGVMTTPAGARYDGHWLEGYFHDQGELCFGDGSVYSGSFRKGREHGRGKLVVADGKVYEGLWAKGECHGSGVLTYPGRKRFEGQFKKSKPHGFGQLEYEDGVTYAGQWQYGEPAGTGRWKDVDGTWLERGEALDGRTDAAPTPISSARGPQAGRVGLPKAPSSEFSSTIGGTSFPSEDGASAYSGPYGNDTLPESRGARSLQLELWTYRPASGLPIEIRADPDVDGAGTGSMVSPGESFQVQQVFAGEDGILYLRLADGSGWLFDEKPGLGKICMKVVHDGHDATLPSPSEAEEAEVDQKFPSKGHFAQRQDAARGFEGRKDVKADSAQVIGGGLRETGGGGAGGVGGGAGGGLRAWMEESDGLDQVALEVDEPVVSVAEEQVRKKKKAGKSSRTNAPV